MHPQKKKTSRFISFCNRSKRYKKFLSTLQNYAREVKFIRTQAELGYWCKKRSFPCISVEMNMRCAALYASYMTGISTINFFVWDRWSFTKPMVLSVVFTSFPISRLQTHLGRTFFFVSKKNFIFV